MKNDTYVLIWKANTAIRRSVKPEGGIVRIAVDDEFLNRLASSMPESYLEELSELKSDLYNQIGYSELGNGAFALTCCRMVRKGLRVTYMTLQANSDKMLLIKDYSVSEIESPIAFDHVWHNVKKEGRKK